jgi:hypothetical protein
MDRYETRKCASMLHNATDWFAIQKEPRKVMPKLLERDISRQKTNEWKYDRYGCK